MVVLSWAVTTTVMVFAPTFSDWVAGAPEATGSPFTLTVACASSTLRVTSSEPVALGTDTAYGVRSSGKGWRQRAHRDRQPRQVSIGRGRPGHRQRVAVRGRAVRGGDDDGDRVRADVQRAGRWGTGGDRVAVDADRRVRLVEGRRQHERTGRAGHRDRVRVRPSGKGWRQRPPRPSSPDRSASADLALVTVSV